MSSFIQAHGAAVIPKSQDRVLAIVAEGLDAAEHRRQGANRILGITCDLPERMICAFDDITATNNGSNVC